MDTFKLYLAGKIVDVKEATKHDRIMDVARTTDTKRKNKRIG